MLVGLLTWWYRDGVRALLNARKENLERISDFFSVELLLKTLFSPFRQISTGSVRGPLAIQVRALLDNLISRIIGLLVRSFMIVLAGISLAVTILYSVLA